jgi:cysteine dioxygenase
MTLSTSPTSVLTYDTGSDLYSSEDRSENSKDTSISLKEFTDALPPILRRLKLIEQNSFQGRAQVEQIRGTKDDPVMQLFSRLDLNVPELQEYALSDPMKNYTRNLVATDNETFTLLLLCWNPGKQSPIHDHPCDGCWVRVCKGMVKETRYVISEESDCLDVTSVATYKDSKEVSYINDFMGYHKVENPSSSFHAHTLHLYCPPFKKCKIWPDPKQASRTSRVCMCNYSEYGDSHACERFAVNMI